MGFEVYPQKQGAGSEKPGQPTGQYGWRYRAEGNDSISAVGGEGFTTEDHAERAAQTVARAISAEVVQSGEVEAVQVKRVEE